MNLKENNMPRFMTVREIAKTGLLSEYCLRRMLREDKLPYIRSGNRYLVNYSLLIEQLNSIGVTNENIIS